MGGRETAKRRSSGLFWRRIRGVFAPRKRITARAHGNDVIPRGNVTSVLRAPRDTNEAQPRVWRCGCDARASICMCTRCARGIQCARIDMHVDATCAMRSRYFHCSSSGSLCRSSYYVYVTSNPKLFWSMKRWFYAHLAIARWNVGRSIVNAFQRHRFFAWKIVSGYTRQILKTGTGESI